jgi:hypothetical protein
MKKIKLTESELVSLIQKMVNEAMSDIDNILDKISQSGMESLSPQEKEYLQHYSTTGEYMDIEGEEDSSYEGENVFSDSIDGINMKFKYESTEDAMDEIIHSGYLEINNDEFYGEIYCDPEGVYSTCNFEDPDGVNLFEKYEGLENEIETFLYSVCDEIKGSNAV